MISISPLIIWMARLIQKAYPGGLFPLMNSTGIRHGVEYFLSGIEKDKVKVWPYLPRLSALSKIVYETIIHLFIF